MPWTDPAITTTAPAPFAGPGAPAAKAVAGLPAVSVANADAYFLTTPRNAEWVAVGDKQVWLNEANRWLGALCFDQAKDCCGRSFDAAYIEAVSELALALSKSPAALVGGGAASSSAGAVKRNQLGDLVQEFYDVKDAGAAATKYGPNAPLVLQRFPFLGDIIGCWLNVATGSSRIIARVRS